MSNLHYVHLSLNYVRHSDDWVEWHAFFLEGVRMTATGAVDTAQQFGQMFQENHSSIETTGQRAGSAIRVHEAFKARPVLPLSEVCKRTTRAFPTSSRAMELLVEHGIAREITGKRRDRLFVYERYLAILDEGTSPV